MKALAAVTHNMNYSSEVACWTSRFKFPEPDDSFDKVDSFPSNNKAGATYVAPA